MYKIIIISDSNKHFDLPIKEYEKRLGKILEIIKIKPIKKGSDNEIIKKETEELIKKLEKLKWFKMILNPNWKNLDTKKFFSLIEEKKQNYWDIIFIIWWALGLDYEKLENFVDFSLSLWKLTMVHSLALLVLIEQIYRIEMIKKWTNYNK